VGVVGCGYWGRNLVRNFSALGALGKVCDESPEGRRLAARLAPDTEIVADAADVFQDPALSGVVIATPAVTHVRLSEQALTSGKDVLCEKPLALRYDEAHRIADLAREMGRILMVGHVLEYHPAIEKAREVVRSGQLGNLRYLYSHRLNLGKVRREENILWSFAPHDIAVILRFVNELPCRVVATGGVYLQPNIADVTVTQLLFRSGVSAHIFVSWLNPFKEQKLVLVGSHRMLTFDDIRKELILHDQRVEMDANGAVAVRGVGEPFVFDEEEPLRRECLAFLEAIRTRKAPFTDAESALRVQKVLQAAQLSLAREGDAVTLPLE
jgi:predicted dehydrogenase